MITPINNDKKFLRQCVCTWKTECYQLSRQFESFGSNDVRRRPRVRLDRSGKRETNKKCREVVLINLGANANRIKDLISANVVRWHCYVAELTKVWRRK